MTWSLDVSPLSDHVIYSVAREYTRVQPSSAARNTIGSNPVT